MLLESAIHQNDNQKLNARVYWVYPKSAYMNNLWGYGWIYGCKPIQKVIFGPNKTIGKTDVHCNMSMLCCSISFFKSAGRGFESLRAYHHINGLS